MAQPEEIVIVVKTGTGRVMVFDATQNMTGYIFVDLVEREFTFDFYPSDGTKNIADAVFRKES